MELGSSNHILLSSTIAENLIPISKRYKKMIRPVGKVKVKHDQEITLYSAYGRGFGNKVKPKITQDKTTKISKSYNSRMILETELLHKKKFEKHHFQPLKWKKGPPLISQFRPADFEPGLRIFKINQNKKPLTKNKPKKKNHRRKSRRRKNEKR